MKRTRCEKTSDTVLTPTWAGRKDEAQQASFRCVVRDHGCSGGTNEPGYQWSAVLVVVGLCVLMLVPVVGQAAPKTDLPELEEIRQDISVLNLLRGLYLSPDQLQKIHDLAMKAVAFRQEIKSEGEKRREEILKPFAELREALFLAPGNEKKAQGEAQNIDHEIKEKVGKAQDAIFGLEEEAGKVLTSAQEAVLADFKACLIPPKSLGDPVRVGQAAATGPLVKVAEMIHGAPADVWKDRGPALLAKMADHCEEELGEMSSAMKSDFQARLQKIAETIRNTSDVDFPLKKDQFSQDLLLVNPKKGFKKGHRKTGEVAQWLLSEAFLRVYPKWVANLKNQAMPDTSDDGEVAGLQSVAEKLDRILGGLRRLHNHRKMDKGLPAYEDLAKPIVEAAQKLDEKAMLTAARQALETVNAVRADKDSVKGLIQLTRFSARLTGYPLLHPNQDPFGFARDLQAAQDNRDYGAAYSQVKALLERIQRFK